MNNHVKDFLEEVCKQIKYKKIHGDISVEMQEHIYGLMEEYIKKGMDRDEAEKKAVEQMGSPIEIGKQLHKAHRPKTEWSIIALIGILVLTGCFVLLSIARENLSIMTIEQFYQSYLVYTLIGIGIGMVCFFFDYTRLEKYSLHIFLATLLFLFVSPWFPNKLNGIPYIVIGPFGFKPVSIVLPFFLISFAGLLNKWVTGDIKGFIKIYGLAGAAVFTCIEQPSLATGMLLGCGFLVMSTTVIIDKSFKGNRKGFLLFVYGSGTAGMLLLFRNPYRVKRLLAFLNFKSDPTGEGYINTVLEKVLSGAKLWGRGNYFDLNGKQAGFIDVPMVNSEFIFTYIVSAFGWIAGLALVCIIVLTIVRMFSATRKIHSTYGRYAASSVVTVFVLQAMANILMNVGLFPILGISLPFISYGGANFITNMALLGLLLGIYRRKDLITADTFI